MSDRDEPCTCHQLPDWRCPDQIRYTEWLRAHDRQVRRQVAEEIATECESNIDWSGGRNGYGDNRGYEHAARIAREVGGADE